MAGIGEKGMFDTVGFDDMWADFGGTKGVLGLVFGADLLFGGGELTGATFDLGSEIAGNVGGFFD